jgi:hypothetical protein
MDTAVLIAIVLIAALVLGGVAYAIWSRQQRSSRLRKEFGTEYDHAVNEYGSKGKAEDELLSRQERVQRLHIQPLSTQESEFYLEQWRSVQSHFVDDPKGSLKEADDLVGQVMEKRGYPVADFDQRASDVSVEHPAVVTNYRAAHEISRASEADRASTEEMRRAMQYYRSLFDDLLATAEVRR